MARERLVTRTITTHVCTIIACNIAESTVFETTVSLPVEFDTMEKATKYLRKNWDISNGTAFVAIKSMKTIEKLYAMSEQMFLAYAHEIPPRETT